MNKLNRRLFFSFLLLFSCSTDVKKVLPVSDDRNDLVDSFQLKDSAFGEYKTIYIDEEKNETDIAKIPTKELHQGKTPEKKKKIEKGNKKLKKKNAEIDIENNNEKSVKAYEWDYPEGYPEIYKIYDKKFKYNWDLFKAKRIVGERFGIVIKYIGVTAGYITLQTLSDVMIKGKKAIHLRASLKSADYYKYIYSLDDYIETYIERSTFLPIKFTLIQRESGQSVDDLQIFDDKNFKTHTWYKRVKKGQIKQMEHEEFIPKYIQDSFSALYFVRSLPLKVNDVYEFPIATRSKIWILKAVVVGKEKIEIMDKMVDAIKLQAQTNFPGVLKKSGDIVFWYSDDEERKILQFSAKVKIGSLSGELVDYSVDK